MWELSMNPIEGKPNPEKLFELQYKLRENRFNPVKISTVPGESKAMEWKGKRTWQCRWKNKRINVRS